MAIIKNWNKRDIIIVDNLVQSFSNDHQNGIPIRAFYDDKEDVELKYLARVLKEHEHHECS
jgi:TFIIF-interacting CTD phosphatase-like protein